MVTHLFKRLVLLSRKERLNVLHRLQSSFKLPNSFYLAVHPDFFNGYPQEQKTNEESLKVLHSYLNGLKNKDAVYAATLTFFVKDQNTSRKSGITPVKVKLQSKSMSQIVTHIMQACNLPDDRHNQDVTKNSKHQKDTLQGFGDEEEAFSSHIYSLRFGNFDPVSKITLGTWLEKNQKTVETSRKNSQLLLTEITEVMQLLGMRYGIKGLSKESFHYSFSMVYNGLKQLQIMLDRYFAGSNVLHGRLVKFGYFNGLDHLGNILFNINDLPSDWRLGVSSVPTTTLLLNEIRELEILLKECCFGLSVIRPRGRTYSFPVHLYAKGLENIYSNLKKNNEVGDYTKKYKGVLSVYDWYADRLAISPEGYLKIPSHVCRRQLCNYLDENLVNVRKTRSDYLRNLHTEQASMLACKLKLHLHSLEKDYMVNTKQTLNGCNQLGSCDNVGLMKHWSVVLSNYYSISVDGLVRIPWNFEV